MEALVTKRARAATYAAPRSILRFGIVVRVPLLYALLVNLFTYAVRFGHLPLSCWPMRSRRPTSCKAVSPSGPADYSVGQIGSFVLVSLGGLVLSTLVMLILCANCSAFP